MSSGGGLGAKRAAAAATALAEPSPSAGVAVVVGGGGAIGARHGDRPLPPPTNLLIAGTLLSVLLMAMCAACYCCGYSTSRTRKPSPSTRQNQRSPEIYSVPIIECSHASLYYEEGVATHLPLYRRPPTPGPPPSYDSVVGQHDKLRRSFWSSSPEEPFGGLPRLQRFEDDGEEKLVVIINDDDGGDKKDKCDIISDRRVEGEERRAHSSPASRHNAAVATRTEGGILKNCHRESLPELNENGGGESKSDATPPTTRDGI